jgi:5-formyltetrahydrofolate cyclo-ligase
MTFHQNPAQQKIRLRAEALSRRDALKPKKRAEWDFAISEQALLLGSRRNGPTKFFGAGPVAGYVAMRSEADPKRILEGLHERGLPLCLPAIVDQKLVFRLWEPGQELVPGGFGTMVPPDSAPVVQPTVLLVPLAAFDRDGNRIGYGKGHYDRALAALPGCLSIGVAFGIQQIDAVPTEPHDVVLDMIITENDVFYS